MPGSLPYSAKRIHSTACVKGFARAAWYTHHAGADPTPETIATVQAAARALADAGIAVERRGHSAGRHIAVARTVKPWRRNELLPESLHVSTDEWADKNGGG